MRVSLGESPGAASESTLFEATDASTERHRELDQERNTEARTRDYSRSERRELDRSEVRQEDLSNEYDHGRERRQDAGKDFTRKIDRAESLAATDAVRDRVPFSEGRADASLPVPAASAVSDHPFSLASTPSTSGADLPGVGAIPGSFLLAGASSQFAGPTDAAGAMTNVAMPVMPTPVLPNLSGNVSTSLQAAASVLTIFSASGRVGNKDERDDAVSEKKKEKKERTVSSFGTTVFDAFLETDRKNTTVDHVRQTESFRVRETEGESSESGKTEDASPKERRDGNSLEHLLKDSKNEPSENVVPTSSESARPVSAEGGASMVEAPENPAPEEQLDRVRFLQRVAAACQSTAHQQGNLRIKVNLDRLGTLTIRSSRQGNKLAVRFETSTEAAAQLLRDHLDELKSLLDEQNVVLDQIDILRSEQAQRD